MKSFLKKWGMLTVAFLALAVAVALPSIEPAVAQVYPTQTPTYIPTAVKTDVTKTVAGTVVANLNGVNTWCWHITGTFTGLIAAPQFATDRNVSPTWATTAVYPVGSTTLPGAGIRSIVAAGTYCLRTSGYTQTRLNITQISTGSVVVGGSGTDGYFIGLSVPFTRQTYIAADSIATGATTHFLTIAGSATTTVRITRVDCSGYATTANVVNVKATKTSTADSVDAGTALTATPIDSQDVAATATPVKHTTSPTSGTLVGNLGVQTLAIVDVDTPVFTPSRISFTFGDQPGEQEVVLRGVAQQFNLDTSAAFGSGAAVGCSIQWTEE